MGRSIESNDKRVCRRENGLELVENREGGRED